MTLRMKLVAACGVALLILGGVSVLSYRWTVRADEDARWVAHTLVVLEKLDSLMVDTVSEETEQRGYVLTGERSHLTSYNEGLTHLRSDLDDLRHLTADDPLQQKAIKQLEPLISRRISGLQEGLAAHGPNSAQSVPKAGHAEPQDQATQEIRSVISAMTAEEDRLLSERTDPARASSRRMKIVIILGNMLAVLFFATAALAIFQEMGKRSMTEESLRQSEERFRLMTARVKEYAIFMLDPGGHVISWNEGARRARPLCEST
jgi:CHASE3 domain sensor protein